MGWVGGMVRDLEQSTGSAHARLAKPMHASDSSMRVRELVVAISKCKCLQSRRKVCDAVFSSWKVLPYPIAVYNRFILQWNKHLAFYTVAHRSAHQNLILKISEKDVGTFGLAWQKRYGYNKHRLLRGRPT